MEARKFVALGSLFVTVRIVAIEDAVSGRESSKVVHCLMVEIQIVVTATDMVPPKARFRPQRPFVKPSLVAAPFGRDQL
jgi:hypothetical protein